MVVDDNNNANAGRGVQRVPDVHGIRKIDLSAATVKKAGAVAKIYAVDIFARRVKSRRLVGVADRKELLSSGVFIDMDDFFPVRKRDGFEFARIQVIQKCIRLGTRVFFILDNGFALSPTTFETQHTLTLQKFSIRFDVGFALSCYDFAFGLHFLRDIGFAVA